MGFKNFEEQSSYWFQHLLDHNFTSDQRQSRKHNNVDILSRLSCPKVEERADVKQVRAIAISVAARWDPANFGTEQLNYQDTGTVLEEEETRQRPEWKDVTDRSPTCKATGPKGSPSL